MRRSAAVTLLVLAAIASACGDGGRRTAPLSIPDEIEGRVPVPEGIAPRHCSLAVGTGMGAEVLEVTPGSAAGEMLEAGDIITQLAGTTVTGASELTAVVRAQQVGDVVRIRATRRGGGPVEGDVQLTEGTAGPDPMLGVVVRTAVELQETGAVEASAALQSPQTAVMAIDGNLFATDVVNGVWLNLDSEAPDGLWVPAGGNVYFYEEGDPDRIINVTDPAASFDFSLEGWEGRALLGSQNGRVLVLAVRGAADLPQFAVIAVDPATRGVAWTFFTNDAERSDFPQPILALSSPSHERTLLVTVQGDAAGNIEVLRFNLIDGEGNIALPVPAGDGSALAGFAIVGWHNDTEVAYYERATGRMLLWNVDTGELRELELPAPTDGNRVVPVGDGSHFIVVGEESINLVGVEEDMSSRRLVVGCSATVAPPGGFVL